MLHLIVEVTEDDWHVACQEKPPSEEGDAEPEYASHDAFDFIVSAETSIPFSLCSNCLSILLNLKEKQVDNTATVQSDSGVGS